MSLVLALALAVPVDGQAAPELLDRVVAVVNDEVVLHPQTHDMLTRDVGIEVDEADGTKSRWVVTGADAVKGEVGMRRYADTTGSRGVTVPLDKLAAGSRVFKFDKAAEGNEVREHMEKAAVAKLEGVEKLEDVQKMPGHVIEANYDLLQRRLKDAAANHKLGAMGNVAMIDKATGKVKSMAYYSAAKAHETHDYALPTDAHREAAIKQWMEERRDARIGSRYVDKPGRRSRGAGGNSDRVLGREHPGADMNKHINPMREVLNAMDGHKAVYGAVSDGPSVRAARARLETEQVAKIKGAKTASEAISCADAAASAAGTGGSGSTGAATGPSATGTSTGMGTVADSSSVCRNHCASSAPKASKATERRRTSRL